MTRAKQDESKARVVSPRRDNTPSPSPSDSSTVTLHSSSSSSTKAIARTGTTGTGSSEVSFPVKLHRLLAEAEKKGADDVVGWNDDGTAFSIYQPKVFAETWMKKYFLQTRYKSFQRQCNLYNFERTTMGKIKGHYSHPFFLRTRPSLCTQIKRDRAPGTALQQAMAAKAASEKKAKKADTSVSGKSEITWGARSKVKVGTNKSKKKAVPGSKKKRKVSNKAVVAEKLDPTKNSNSKVPTHQVSPTGVDTAFFERQVLTFGGEDDTGFSDIPETLMDPLNCFQESDTVNRPDFSLNRRQDLSSSAADDLEEWKIQEFGSGFFNFGDSNYTLSEPSPGGVTDDDHSGDDTGSIFSISDVPMDESPTINDLNDIDMIKDLSELVSDVPDKAVSFVASPDGISDSTAAEAEEIEDETIRSESGGPPASPHHDGSRHVQVHPPAYHPHHHHHYTTAHHYGHHYHYASYAGAPAHSYHHIQHTSASSTPTIQSPTSHVAHYNHHRPLYYPCPIGPPPAGLYHHVQT
mmetsp:Transcript_23890/g.56429  ORF Transcript_23890/g.56429 Transcript_23890/m.56429 type:complete len:521 (-) Transcript_23890:149-1711(-)